MSSFRKFYSLYFDTQYIDRHRPHCLLRGLKVKVALFDIVMELTVRCIALLIISFRNFGCPCARDNQKSHRTTINIDVVVQPTIINFHVSTVKLEQIYLVPSADNQNLGRTTRKCNLVVRGTTIYFFLIRTLLLINITLNAALHNAM